MAKIFSLGKAINPLSSGTGEVDGKSYWNTGNPTIYHNLEAETTPTPEEEVEQENLWNLGGSVYATSTGEKVTTSWQFGAPVIMHDLRNYTPIINYEGYA